MVFFGSIEARFCAAQIAGSPSTMANDAAQIPRTHRFMCPSCDLRPSIERTNESWNAGQRISEVTLSRLAGGRPLAVAPRTVAALHELRRSLPNSREFPR